MSAEDRLLLVSEAAERLRLSVKTVRLYLRTKVLTGIKTVPSGQWRISESEVARYEREGGLPPDA